MGIEDKVQDEVLQWVKSHNGVSVESVGISIKATKEFFSDREESVKSIRVGWDLAPGTYPNDEKHRWDITGQVQLDHDYKTYDEATKLEISLEKAIQETAQEKDLSGLHVPPMLIQGIADLPVIQKEG